MPRRESNTMDLRAQLNKALQQGQVIAALDLYELIEARKPDEPRWPHRKGDLLLRMGHTSEAALAYERAVELYLAKGFEARAAATAKMLARVTSTRSQPIEHNGAMEREPTRLADAVASRYSHRPKDGPHRSHR